jgi:transposase
MGKRQRYDGGFKKEAVKAALDAATSGGSVSTIAESLGMKENTLQKWVKDHKKRADREAVGGLSETERSELGNLRREVKRLRVEREILKKATAFFAKENA